MIQGWGQVHVVTAAIEIMGNCEDSHVYDYNVNLSSSRRVVLQ